MRHDPEEVLMDHLLIQRHESAHALHAFVVGGDVRRVEVAADGTRGSCLTDWPFPTTQAFVEAFEQNPPGTLLQAAGLLGTICAGQVMDGPGTPLSAGDGALLERLHTAYLALGSTEQEWSTFAGQAYQTLKRWAARPDVGRCIAQLALCLYQQPTMSKYAWQSALEVCGAALIPGPLYAVPAYPRAWRPTPSTTSAALGTARDIRAWWPSLQGDASPGPQAPCTHESRQPRAIPAPAPQPSPWTLKPRLLKPRSLWRSGGLGALA